MATLVSAAPPRPPVVGLGRCVAPWHGAGPGVTLQLNDRVVARTPKHQVIDALLQTWAEGEPVPQRVNQALEKHPCQH